MFTIEHNPNAADGAVWTVLSPQGTSVWRTPDSEEAIRERDSRNEAWGLGECSLHPRYTATLPPRSTSPGCICRQVYEARRSA